MATNHVNEPHRAIPSIFRLSPNKPSPAITDRRKAPQRFSSLRCRAHSTEPGTAEEQTEKISVGRVPENMCPAREEPRLALSVIFLWQSRSYSVSNQR